MLLHEILQDLHAHVGVVDLKRDTVVRVSRVKPRSDRTPLTDLTRWPMPMISFPSFFILLTNSIGSMPLSKALLNCLAAASRAPPKRSPF